jgi:hypothetical protein
MMPLVIVPSNFNSSHLQAGPNKPAVNFCVPGKLLITLEGPPNMATPSISVS